MPIFLRKVLFVLIIIFLVYGVYRLIDKNNTFDKKDEIIPPIETGTVVVSGEVSPSWEVASWEGYGEIFEEESGTGSGKATGDREEILLEKDAFVDTGSVKTTGDKEEILLEKDTIVESGTTTSPKPTTTTKKTTTTTKTTTPTKTSSPDSLLGELFN